MTTPNPRLAALLAFGETEARTLADTETAHAQTCEVDPPHTVADCPGTEPYWETNREQLSDFAARYHAWALAAETAGLCHELHLDAAEMTDDDRAHCARIARLRTDGAILDATTRPY